MLNCKYAKAAAAFLCLMACACGKKQPENRPVPSEETKAQVKSALIAAHRQNFADEIAAYGIAMPSEAKDMGLRKATYKKAEVEVMLFHLPKASAETYAASFRKGMNSTKKLIPLDQEETSLALLGESETRGIAVAGADMSRNQTVHVFVERDRSVKQKFNRPYQIAAVIFTPIEVR